MSGVATAQPAPTPTRGVEPPARREAVWVGALVLLGFVLRLAWSLYASRHPAGLNDPDTYLVTAHDIAAGRGYRFILDGAPTAYFPPGYPALVAAVVWVVDHTPLGDVPRWVGVLQALLGAASVWLTWRITRRIATRPAALVAAALVAVFPGLLLYSAPLLSETLFVFIELVAMAVLVDVPWGPRGPSTRRLLVVGVLIGLGALVRPQAALLIVAFALALLIARSGWRRALAAGAIVVVAAALTIVPWTVRNAITMNAFIPISTNGADDLCIGHNPGATGAFAFYGDCLDIKGLKGGEREVKRERKNTREALHYAWTNPRRELWLLGQKALYTYDGDYEAVDAVEAYGHARFLPSGLRSGLKHVSDGYFWIVVLLGIAGLPFLARGRDPKRLFVLLSLVAMALAPLVFFGDVRFHVPASPLFAIAAAIAITTLPRALRRR
jgi:4-amino-4-deoxy-L-arabinose transferase-like glycosyltransferase